MKIKRVFKISIWLILGLVGILLLCIGYIKYLSTNVYVPSKNEFTKRVAYIDIDKAKNTKNFVICNDKRIVDYYNYAKGDSINRVTSYISGKNGLRKEVLSKYENRNYKDSGYLNFRFIVNCKGEAGAYVIHQNNLGLEPFDFDTDLVNQLFEITVALKEWQPNFMRGDNRDSYMYISYRIENGEITEILP